MRKQIGWYDPLTYLMYTMLEKAHGLSHFETHTEKLLANDETEIPMPECKKPRDDDARPTTAEVWNRILVNQQRMMFAMCDLGELDVDARATLAEACRRTGDVIDKTTMP